MRASTEKRRKEILDAALACFREQGFGATSMEQIRSRSGASVGSIYHHFHSKEELAQALYIEGLADYQQSLLVELTRHRTAESKTRAVVDHYLGWVSDHLELMHYLVQMRQADFVAQSEIRASRAAFFRAAAEFFRGHLENGELRAMPFELFVALTTGPVQEYTRHWLGHPDPGDLKKARKILADAAWASVRKE